MVSASKTIQLKMPNYCVLVQVYCKYEGGHTGRRKEKMIFPPVKLHSSLLAVNNDKVALWCRWAGFHFLATSKLWAFNPRWKCQALRMLPQLFFRLSRLGRPQQIWKRKKIGRLTFPLLFPGLAVVFLKLAVRHPLSAWTCPEQLPVNAAEWLMRMTLYCD